MERVSGLSHEWRGCCVMDRTTQRTLEIFTPSKALLVTLASVLTLNSTKSTWAIGSLGRGERDTL